METMNASNPTSHKYPKCTHCGYEGEWKLEPIFRPMDWIIGILFMFALGSGLVYLIVVGLLRSNKDRRAKICPHCKARNLWTFLY